MSGFIGDIINNRADVAAMTMTVREERMEVVDFSYPVGFVQVNTSFIHIIVLQSIYFVAAPTVDKDVSFILKPFTLDLWMSFVAVIAVMCVVHWLCYVCISIALSSQHRVPVHGRNSLSCSCWEMYALLFNQVLCHFWK
jgi:hypothetical protein